MLGIDDVDNNVCEDDVPADGGSRGLLEEVALVGVLGGVLNEPRILSTCEMKCGV